MIFADPENGFVELELPDFVRFPYKKPGRWWDVGKYARQGTQRKKSTRRVFDVIKPDKVPGQRAFRSMREQHLAQFRNKPGFASWKRTRTPDGMNREQADKAWKVARKEAIALLPHVLNYWRMTQENERRKRK
jgi:hypothetical protein